MDPDNDPGQTKRLALITGAASGLAAGIARRLASAGYRIAFTYRSGGTSPDATLAAIRPDDPAALAVANALDDEAAARALIAEVEGKRGPISVVVHTVGPIVVRSFAKSTAADYRAMVDGNLGTAVHLAFAVLPGMRERGFGRLVFFGMNGSHATQPAKLMAIYAAAKAGVVTFARTLSLEEAARGITVNVIEPGDIRDKTVGRAEARARSADNPTGHPGTWEDIADAVRFVVADAAGYFNGMVMSVNGGLIEPHE